MIDFLVLKAIQDLDINDEQAVEDLKHNII